MKVYRDLVIRGAKPTLTRFMVELGERLSGGWTRHRTRELQVRGGTLVTMYCFLSPECEGRPASELWLAGRSDGALFVSNVLAVEKTSLTHDEYNSIVQEFHDRFAAPAAAAAEANVELGKTEHHVEDFLSRQTAGLLRSFSSKQFKYDPIDRESWNRFLSAAHREGAALSPSMLQRWLIDDQKWPEDKAIDLAIEYEHGRELLGVF